MDLGVNSLAGSSSQHKAGRQGLERVCRGVGCWILQTRGLFTKIIRPFDAGFIIGEEFSKQLARVTLRTR
ncbi:hypothetical protein PTI98_002361 [Pleurotus ostreatus]|nr:hypothetical protein PTI98_002361 [Pleurotus ostreatus]